MKFDISSSELLKQLQVAGGAVSSSPVLPILEDFLFTISDNNLEIAATDLETSIRTRVPVKAEGNGRVTMPARTLLDTLKALPEQPITFTVDEEVMSIQITSNHGKYKLSGQDYNDFPVIPTRADDDSATVPGKNLLRAISKTLFATSNDELRPAMSGVYLQVDFNKVTFVATDAHKLVRYTTNGTKSDVSTHFIIPKKGLQLLKNALEEDAEVEMAFNKEHVFFSFGSINMSCRLIDGKYPDYNAVIPIDNPFLLTIARQDFQNSLRRIIIYANKTTNQVVLNVSDGSLTVSAQDLDFSNEATEQLPCSYDGDPLTIAFNAKFLLEMLNALDSENVKMLLATPGRAGILLPEEPEAGEDILMLVMPVMINA